MSMPEPVSSRFHTDHDLGLARRAARARALAALPPADGLATHALGLADLGKRAAEIISERGWVQNHMEDAATGAVCLHGALQRAATAPERDGRDFRLVSVLYSRRGSTMSWNDHTERTEAEVLAALETDPLTDAECAALLGPQWIQMVALLREAGADALHLARSVPRPVHDDVHPHDAVLAMALLCGFPIDDLPADHGRHGMPPWLGVTEVPRHIAALAAATLTSQRVQEHLSGPVAMASAQMMAELPRPMRIAAAALSLRDLLLGTALGAEVYAAAVGPVAAHVGPLHPDDPITPAWGGHARPLSEVLPVSLLEAVRARRLSHDVARARVQVSSTPPWHSVYSETSPAPVAMTTVTELKLEQALAAAAAPITPTWSMNKAYLMGGLVSLGKATCKVSDPS